MNVEELDGFLAALLAGPDLVMPSDFLPMVLGGEADGTTVFAGTDGIEGIDEILGLIMRHWNGIAAKLRQGDVVMPILLEDETGVARGNEWAHGFILGTETDKASWAELLNDEAHGGCMLAALMLHYEHDDDPELRSPPIGPEQREDVIVQMAAGVTQAFRYFQRRAPTRGRAKTGRNEPCPCGSGKKYKRCCGGATIH